MNRPRNSLRTPRKHSRRFFLRAAATVACAGAATFIGFPPRLDCGNEKPPRKKFDPSTYTPPEGAVVLERSIIVGPTIIYIPDYLSDPRRYPSHLQSIDPSAHVQQSIFKVIQSLAEYSDEIPIVQENMPHGIDPLFAMQTGDPENSPYPHEAALLQQAARDPDPERRMRLIEHLLGNSIVSPYSLAVAAYQERVRTLTSAPTEKQNMTDLKAAFSSRLLGAFEGEKTTIPCPNDNRYELSSAVHVLERTTPMQPELLDFECYCGTAQRGYKLQEEIIQNRMENAPWREIQNAHSYAGPSPFVIVISRIHHARTMMKYLHERTVRSFMMIAPKKIQHLVKNPDGKKGAENPFKEYVDRCQQWLEEATE